MGMLENVKRTAQIGLTSLTGFSGMSAAVGGLGALSAPKADAALMVTFDNYDAHKELANNPAYQFASYIEVTTPSGSIATSSGIAIAPNIILVAAHSIPSATNSAVVSSVIMGSNVFGSGATSYTVASWERFSGYIPGNTSTLDFGLVYLNENIPGFTPVSFGSATVGQTLTLVEYGRIGEQNGSTTYPTLGDRLAGYTPVVNDSGILGYPQSSYLTTELSLGLPVNSLNVLGLPGSSGGALFNDLGQIVGIQTASSNGMWGGYSAAMRTDNEVFLNYVNPRIEDSWSRVPEPSLPLLIGFAALGSAFIRRKES